MENNRKSEYNERREFPYYWWSLYGIFTFGGFLMECNRIHKEKFAALPTQWQNFYTTINEMEMDMNTRVQHAAIRDFIRSRSPSLTLAEYETLGGTDLLRPQRTFTHGVIRSSILLQEIIKFDFEKGEE